MTSRRDELNAYTFARKRTVGSFLKPLPNGSMDSVPRPFKAVLPSLILAIVILIGFGAWGLIKPKAPKGWDAPGEKVIVGDKSTTRYVVLQDGPEGTDGKKTPQLHPVLNLASAKLVLTPGKFSVVKVNEDELDSGKLPHGPTIGIPYAPDRLPNDKTAGTPKVWALCEQPGGGIDKAPEKAVFVFGEKDIKRIEGKDQLKSGDAMFVEAPGRTRYLVDHRGIAYPLGTPEQQKASPESTTLLSNVLFSQGAQPQKVTADWIATLNPGTPLAFPTTPGAGEPSTAEGVPEENKFVGRVLVAALGGEDQHYVVLSDHLAPVSDFTARLLLQGSNVAKAYGGAYASVARVATPSVAVSAEEFMADRHWPELAPQQANDFDETDGRKVACSVYRGSADTVPGMMDITMWAGTEYPATIAGGAISAYVTPGSGLLFRQVEGNPKVGPIFLVTDTGLRYSVPANNDSEKAAGNAEEELNNAQARLGYGGVDPVPVPKTWSQMLSAGPALSTDGASQPQSS